VCDAAGMAELRLNACGYGLGTTFAPNWMDWPMLYTNNPVILQPGMVFFMHMILFDAAAGVAVTLARTYLVTQNGNEPLSRSPFVLQVA
jgi:Xaa-Pro dipeptidase